MKNGRNVSVLTRQQLFRGLFRQLSVVLVVSTVVASPVAGGKDGSPSRPSKSATSDISEVYMFNMTPGGTYAVRKDGVDLTAGNANPWGVLSFVANTTGPAAIHVGLTGDDPVKPSTPVGFTALDTDIGCADLSWTTPDSEEYVHEYVLVWGPSSGVFTDSVTVRVSNIESQSGTSMYSLCGLSTGYYCLRIRAHNHFDLWSAYSEESCADVTNGSTQGPTIPRNVTATETTGGCASVTWSDVGDLTVTGYKVYYGGESVEDGSAGSYDDSLDVGDETSAEICDFTDGIHYFAVKSYTGTGLSSAFSNEQSLEILGEEPPDTTEYAEEPRGQIVPDGFWANDPSRPLEVHNLSKFWTVRIFDTAGRLIKSETITKDNKDWEWNFMNDKGRRVARALYLIRVTDEAGNVRRSGRFLVQIDP